MDRLPVPVGRVHSNPLSGLRIFMRNNTQHTGLLTASSLTGCSHRVTASRSWVNEGKHYEPSIALTCSQRGLLEKCVEVQTNK